MTAQMKTLDARTIPLQSINLIEASAGTGKSWTVTYLYLRLILEQNLKVDQILVVTFTDAATKELRDAVRQRIIDALNAFEIEVNGDGYSEDNEYLSLINNSTDHEEAIRRLHRAKLSMDESAIFTIHSFCQRSLKENAFEASLPFESELISDDADIMQKLTDDFWRRYTQNTPKSLLFKLQQKSITPDSLLKDIKPFVGKPYLEIYGPESDDEKSEKWQLLEDSYHHAMSIWKTQGDEITALFNHADYEKHYYKGLIDNRDACFKAINSWALSDTLPPNVDLKTMKWLGTEKKLKATAKGEPLEHIFFQAFQDFLDHWKTIDSGSDRFINTLRIELIKHLQAELPKEKQRLGVLSFDDFLLQLQQTLHNHPQLAKQLRTQYQAALIDEFQDTDPIQYDIFRSIYNDPKTTHNAVFLVGDPKQAIYSFRGGDIYTYLKAKSETLAENQYTLDRNWRSHKDLISAFNTLYSIADDPFKDKGIVYTQVKSGTKTTDALNASTAREALNFWHYTFDESDAPKVGVIRKQIADSVAGDIAQTLNDGLEGKATIGEKAISGGDIAILVRSHSQANSIKKALNARGIPSVQNSRDSIYHTHEATELVYLLSAIISPQNEDEVRRAIVTDMMAYGSEALLAFQEDSEAWEALLLAMQNWHLQWKKQGFLSMMRSLMKAENTHRKLLLYPDGERRISNILQLSELIHQSARNNMLGMIETLRWFKKQQLSTNANETELRLESDDDLVKIVTIHKSKGLEYPIVYCPFIGISATDKSDKVFTFNKDNRASLEIGSALVDDHKALKKEEDRAEDTRLLYVALTRAKYQCNVVCFTQAISRSPDNTALGWLLTNGQSVKADKDTYFTAYQQNLDRLKASGASISVDAMPEYALNLRYQTHDNKQKLSAREFTATIKQQAQITSFSGLTAGAHDEAPDYDAIAERKDKQSQLQLPPAAADEFPRGATAGTALHEIFEHIDFITPIQQQSELVATTLGKYGFEEKHQPAAMQLIKQSLDATLIDVNNKPFTLKQLSKTQRLDEMEFYLPLDRLQINHLQQLLYQHLPQTEQWQVVRDAVSNLYFEDVQGFLKGFIDLIFEHEGQYYLADYKSNTLVDYEETALFEAMAHSHYYLQYLFYSVALHRYLKQRIATYHWDTHIGGAYYLFVRGMQASQTQTADSSEHTEHNENIENIEKMWGGVFYDKPSLSLIEALDNLFKYREIA